MSENSSSQLSSLWFHHCSNIYIGFLSIRAFLLVPVSTFVLHLGLRRWQQQHSFKAASHSDIFTYHQALMELIWVVGCFFEIYDQYVSLFVTETVGMCLIWIAVYGEIMFHILTCAECYIAVVHPVTYRGLKNNHGVRIRNIVISCVWLLCLVLMSLRVLKTNLNRYIPLYCISGLALLATSFCILSVLCALVRPGPGAGGGEKERVDQSKQRAFRTITVISSTQWLWFVGLLVSTMTKESPLLGPEVSCFVAKCACFCNLPSCLVLPLLYLHRAGKLPMHLSCCLYCTNRYT